MNESTTAVPFKPIMPPPVQGMNLAINPHPHEVCDKMLAGLDTNAIDELMRQFLNKRVQVQMWSMNIKTHEKFYQNVDGTVKYVGGGIALVSGSVDGRMFAVHHAQLVIMKEAMG